MSEKVIEACDHCGKKFRIPDSVDPSFITCSNCDRSLSASSDDESSGEKEEKEQERKEDGSAENESSDKKIVSCDHCDKKFRVPDSIDPSTIRCSGCGNTLKGSTDSDPSESSPSTDESQEKKKKAAARSSSLTGSGGKGSNGSSTRSGPTGKGPKTSTPSPPSSRKRKRSRNRSRKNTSSTPPRSSANPSRSKTPTSRRNEDTSSTTKRTKNGTNKYQKSNSGSSRSSSDGSNQMLIGLGSFGILIFLGILVISSQSSDVSSPQNQTSPNNREQQIEQNDSSSRDAKNYKDWNPGGKVKKKAKERQKKMKEQSYGD